MAVEVAAMGPVLVQGRTSEMSVGHCSKKGCPAGRRSYVLVDVSLVAAADRAAPQAQQQHLMTERHLQQVSPFPHEAGSQQVDQTPPATLFQEAVLVVQYELLFQLSLLLVGACVQAPYLSQQMCYVFLLALGGGWSGS